MQLLLRCSVLSSPALLCRVASVACVGCIASFLLPGKQTLRGRKEVLSESCRSPHLEVFGKGRRVGEHTWNSVARKRSAAAGSTSRDFTNSIHGTCCRPRLAWDGVWLQVHLLPNVKGLGQSLIRIQELLVVSFRYSDHGKASTVKGSRTSGNYRAHKLCMEKPGMSADTLRLSC